MILDILKDFTAFKDRLLIDHCTPETIDPVLCSGFWAGITLSPVKFSVRELPQNRANGVKPARGRRLALVR
ncbi:MAG: hypothetical protein ACLFUL_16895 [Desulfobacteraceae bacterium]